MKEQTIYIAEDGTRFDDSTECAEYEATCGEINFLISKLKPKPKLEGCAFENGAGYVQQEPKTFKAVKLGLLTIANRLMPHDWFAQAMESETVHPSWAGRLIDEMSHRALNAAWYRIYCTDAQCREWGQPYYASHPESAQQVALVA